mmetsp:Transcript_43683/g.103098  ORF Transcript_43683/g.103098 Transcript_43683/m.103098 type:complete len:409 (-) Transcript_43683:169-1395(-)
MEQHASPLTSKEERLKLLLRTLQETVELLQASTSEDSLLNVILRQHDKAVQSLDSLAAQHQHVEQSVLKLRCDVAQAERHAARVRASRRVADSAAIQHKQRASAHQHQAAQHSVVALRAEAEGIEAALQQSIARNQELQAEIRDLEQQHASTLAENANAQRMLGLSEAPQPRWKERGMKQRAETYRKAHEKERAEATQSLERARVACEEQMEALAEVCAGHEAKFHDGMEKLRQRFLSLQALVDERYSEVSSKLTTQEAHHTKCIHDNEAQALLESRRLQDLKQEKLTMGSYQVAQAEQGLVEAVECTRRQLQQHSADLRHAYRYKVRMEEARIDDVLRDVQMSVAHARHGALLRERHKDRLLRDYHAHALSTGAYVKNLEKERRDRIWQSHRKVGLKALECHSARLA